jgi:hypothetical protein
MEAPAEGSFAVVDAFGSLWTRLLSPLALIAECTRLWPSLAQGAV